MAVTRVNLTPMAPPAPGHPLASLIHAFNTTRDLAIERRDLCERLAPTPYAMSDADPADALTGTDRDLYVGASSQARAYEDAASLLRDALAAVIDELGGL